MGRIYWLLRMKLVHLVLNGLKGSNCDGMGKQIRGGNEGMFELKIFELRRFGTLGPLGQKLKW